jgi:serine/threonine protein kinase
MMSHASFRFLKDLGHGGMGQVWSAHHELLGDVAVKVLSETYALSPELKTRLVREGRMTARITSPYVVRVIECGLLNHDHDDPSPYIAMERIAGEDLAVTVNRAGVLPLSHIIPIVQKAAWALEAVHAAGVVHGDVKLENLVVSEGPEGFSVKLIDFGLARAFDEPAFESDALPCGTPSSMAPEQISAPSHLSTCWDVWGLSVLSYRALTGRCVQTLARRSTRYFRGHSRAIRGTVIQL